MTSRKKAIAALAGIFVLGTAVGALGVGLFVRHQVHEAQRLQNAEGFREYFADKLDLTNAQVDSLRGELDRAYADLAEFRAAAADEYRSMLDTFVAHVDPKLRPEQRAILERQAARLRHHLPAPRHQPEFLHEPLPPIEPGTDSSAAHAESDTASAPVVSPTRPKRARGQLQPMVSQSEDSISVPSDANDLGREQFDPGSALGQGLAERLHARLNLTEDQTTRATALIASARQSIGDELWRLRGMPRLQRGAVARELRRFNSSMVDLLDPRQSEVYQDSVREQIRTGVRRHLHKILRLESGR